MLRLSNRSDKRNHQLYVHESHVVANLPDRRAFEFKARSKAVRNIARSAAKSEHRIFLVGFISFATNQVCVFIGLEIRHAHDYGLRRECSGNNTDSLGQSFDKEADRVAVASHLLVDCFASGCIEVVVVQQCLGVHTNHAIYYEFQTCKTDTMVGNIREIECPIRITHIHHYLDWNFRQCVDVDLLLLEVEFALVNETLVAFGATDRDFLTVLNRFGGICTADYRWNTEFTGKNGSVAGAAAPICDNRRSAFHDRFPVRVGHV